MADVLYAIIELMRDCKQCVIDYSGNCEEDRLVKVMHLLLCLFFVFPPAAASAQTKYSSALHASTVGSESQHQLDFGPQSDKIHTHTRTHKGGGEREGERERQRERERERERESCEKRK